MVQLVDLYDCQHLSSCKVTLVEPAEVGTVAVQVVAGVGGHWGGSWHIFNVNVKIRTPIYSTWAESTALGTAGAD